MLKLCNTWESRLFIPAWPAFTGTYINPLEAFAEYWMMCNGEFLSDDNDDSDDDGIEDDKDNKDEDNHNEEHQNHNKDCNNKDN